MIMRLVFGVFHKIETLKFKFEHTSIDMNIQVNP